jgi:hypothetical protein
MHGVSHKPGITGNIGMLTQLLQNTLNMLISYSDVKSQTILSTEENGMKYLISLNAMTIRAGSPGQFEVPSHYLPEGTKKNHENPLVSKVGVSGEIRTRRFLKKIRTITA